MVRPRHRRVSPVGTQSGPNIATPNTIDITSSELAAEMTYKAREAIVANISAARRLHKNAP